MRCPKCLTRFHTMRVLEGCLVAYVCEKCERSFPPEEALNESSAGVRTPAFKRKTAASR